MSWEPACYLFASYPIILNCLWKRLRRIPSQGGCAYLWKKEGEGDVLSVCLWWIEVGELR